MHEVRPFALCTLALMGLACGAPADKPAPTTPPAAEQAAVPQLAKTLRAVVWDDYITPGIAAAFEKEFGVHVEVDFVNNNEEVLARLEAGEVWDLWTPSDYAVQIAKEKGLLARLDHARITNLSNVGRRYQNLAYDRQFEYAVPYYWGTTGLAYDKKAYPGGVNSWAAVFEDSPARRAHAGKIQLLDDMRETMSIALIFLGKDPNTSDSADIAAARDLLLKTKPVLSGLDSESYEDNLASGKNVLAHGWSGDLLQVVSGSPERAYVLPKEGFMVWIDNFAIPAKSQNKETAEVFLNFMLRPGTAARVTNESLNPTTVPASRPLVDPKILEGQTFDLPEDRPFWIFRHLGPANEYFEKAWAEFVRR